MRKINFFCRVLVSFIVLLPLNVYSQEITPVPSFNDEEAMFWGEKEVLITATLFERPISEAPAIATVFNAKDIKDMGARDFKDVLRVMPGVDVFKNPAGNGVNSVTIRGWGTEFTSEILYMIDGHRINTLFAGEPTNIYDDLVVEDIKRIELIRGPGSALYGADAFSGIINIITKNAEDVNGVEVSARGGSYDSIQPNILIGKVLGKLDLLANINYLHTGGPHLEVKKDSIYQYPFSLSPGDTDYPRDKIDADLKAALGDFSLRFKYTGKETGPFIGINHALNNDSKISLSQCFGELRYEHTFFEKLGVMAKVYADRYTQENDLQGYPPGYTTFDKFRVLQYFPQGVYADGKLKNKGLGFEARADYELFKNNKIIVGVQVEGKEQYDVSYSANFNPLTFSALPKITDVSSFANFNQDASRDIWALYAEDEWELRDGMWLNLGVRYDHYSDFGETVNPRAGFIWNFIEKAVLKILYGQAFRAPTFVEVYTQNNPVILGNQDLSPEHIKTAEVGLEYDFTKSLKGRVNVFKSWGRDLIVAQTSGIPLVPGEFMNTEGKDEQGVEVEVKSYWGKDNYVYANYSYTDVNDLATGEGLIGLPANKANIGVNFMIGRYVDFNTYVLLRDKRMREMGDTRPDLPGYGVVNTTVTLKNFLSTWEIALSVYNLFDKTYYDPTRLGTMVSDYPNEGRSFWLTADYKF
jgi:iron complex outermembrane receptor protein